MTYMEEPECSDECTCEARSKWAMQEVKIMKSKIARAITTLEMNWEPENNPDYYSEKLNFVNGQLGHILDILEGRE